MSLLIGIDEAGMGTLAGPMTASIVVFEEGKVPRGVRDSKALSEARREELAAEIMSSAYEYYVVERGADLIDRHGLSACWESAMKELAGLGQLCYPRGVKEFIVDGNRFVPDSPFVQPVVKADVTHPAVSAASILAKYTQCCWMDDAHLKYPQYRFDHHRGYGSAEHLRILKELGPCPIHRKSYKPVRLAARS